MVKVYLALWRRGVCRVALVFLGSKEEKSASDHCHRNVFCFHGISNTSSWNSQYVVIPFDAGGSGDCGLTAMGVGATLLHSSSSYRVTHTHTHTVQVEFTLN